MSEILKLENVRKSFALGEGTVEIVRGITMAVQEGEFVGIMGSSGSGKSSLMNLIGLLDRPSSGTVRFMGRDVSGLTEDDQAELRCRSIGFIFQHFHLLPYLTAEQNVALPMEYAGQEGGAAHVRELLSRVGLAHRARAFPATMSGGERQRVAIARALANKPVLLLADEPTGALDSRTGAQVMNFLGELHRAGGTILLITHDEAVARRAARMLTIKDGKLE